MYSRKQFLFKALQKMTRLAGAIPLCFSPFYEPESPMPNGFDTKKLFQKAMALGIDPGTMDITQLTKIVQMEDQSERKMPI